MHRKFAYVFIALLLIAAIANPLALLAATDMTAEEKYWKLVEKGAFPGYGDQNQNQQDQSMTRAQIAMIISQILGLQQSPEYAQFFKDLGQEWDWLGGYAGALYKSGIMVGKDVGIFDPVSDVTIQELATVMVRALNLPYDSDTTYPGADDWAGGFVKAAVDAGLIPPLPDYTVPASRDILVEASYPANQYLSYGSWVQSVKQTGARRVSVEINGAFDPDATTIVIGRIGEDEEQIAVGIESLEWSDDGSLVTVVLSEDAEAGKYVAELTVDHDGESIEYSWRFEMEDERLDHFELGGSGRLPRADNVEVPYFLYNQFGEPMSHPPGDLQIDVASNAKVGLHPDRQAVLVNLADLNDNRVMIALAVNQKQISRFYEIDDPPVVRNVETVGFVDETGAPVASLKKGESAYLLLRPYDQYGNLITDIDWLNENLQAVVSSTGNGDRSRKLLTQVPDGAVAVRVTAGSYWVNSSIEVDVYSPDNRVLAHAAIPVEHDPSLYVVPTTTAPVERATIAVDPNLIVTVGDPADQVSDVTTYVYVTSENVDTLYYVVVISSEEETPTADDLMNDWSPSGALPPGPGTAPTDGQARLALKLQPGGQYILYIVGAKDNGSLVSDVLTVNLDTDAAGRFHLSQVIDKTNYSDPTGEQWEVYLIHSPADAVGTVYYVVTDNPFYPTSEEEIVQAATAADPSDIVDVGIVNRGVKEWSGIADSIVIDGRESNNHYHIYVVLEYRGVRLMGEGILGDSSV